jgi:hypothetical protein
VRSARGASIDTGDFAVGRCSECRRDVLTYPDGEDPVAGETRRCLHCDERLHGALRWIDVADLEALGYVVDSGEERSSGCTSCANGGCAVRPVNEKGAAR